MMTGTPMQPTMFMPGQPGSSTTNSNSGMNMGFRFGPFNISGFNSSNTVTAIPLPAPGMGGMGMGMMGMPGMGMPGMGMPGMPGMGMPGMGYPMGMGMGMPGMPGGMPGGYSFTTSTSGFGPFMRTGMSGTPIGGGGLDLSGIDLDSGSGNLNRQN
jgi:hypothetical protein